MEKKLSFIIPTWNTAKITKKCVDSINKYLSGQEIIVVDNGSQDNTVSILSKVSNVILIKNSTNLGFSKANNLGVKSATSDYLIFMNSDIELIDNSLYQMVSYLKKHPQIGIIGPMFLNPDLTTQASVFPPQNCLNAFKEYWIGQIGSYTKYTPRAKKPVSVKYLSGGFFVINKKYFKKIGKWNEKYYFYYEDMDLCRQVVKSGKKVIYYPKCKVIHRHGASGKILADSKNQWRRLVPSSIKFHGYFKHYLINFIIWSGQKINKIINYFNTY